MANVYATIKPSGVLEQSNCLTSGARRVYATLLSVGILEQPSCFICLTSNIMSAFTEPLSAVMQKYDTVVT